MIFINVLLTMIFINVLLTMIFINVSLMSEQACRIPDCYNLFNLGHA